MSGEAALRPARPRTAQARDAARAELLDAAAKLFVAEGDAGFSMRRLAAEVGVSPMALYRYFPDKQALMTAVRAQAFDRLADALEATEQDARHRAADVGDAYVRFAFENRAAYALMFAATPADELADPALAGAADRAREAMAAYVYELVDAGVLKGDPVELGYVFWATIHGLIVLALAGRLPTQPGFEHIRRTALGALMRGLRP